MAYWSSSRSEILLQCIKDSNYGSKIEYRPESLEQSVNRLQSLFFEIRNHFIVDEMYICHDSSIEQLDHLTYDKEFYDSIEDYLNSDRNFQYSVRPELQDLQLNTIKYVIETMVRFMNLSSNLVLFLPTGIKEEIIVELSRNYNVANDKFIIFYENIFNDLQDNLNDESNVNSKKVQRIRDQILDSEIDILLFTELAMFIRSQMVSEK